MRARAHICAYFADETTDEKGIVQVARKRRAEVDMATGDTGNHERDSMDMLPSLNYKAIQKPMKCFKVHRGAFDFDKSFIFMCIIEIND